jgi:hypothetical protein
LAKKQPVKGKTGQATLQNTDRVVGQEAACQGEDRSRHTPGTPLEQRVWEQQQAKGKRCSHHVFTEMPSRIEDAFTMRLQQFRHAALIHGHVS